MAKLQALGYIGAGEATRATRQCSQREVPMPPAPRARGTTPGSSCAASIARSRRAPLSSARLRSNRISPRRCGISPRCSPRPVRASAPTICWRARSPAACLTEPDSRHRPRARRGARRRHRAQSGAARPGGRGAPEEADLWLFRGRFRIQIGDCRSAASDLARAGELAPGNSDIFATTALAQICTGDRSAAIASLRRALELAPDEPRLRALLAELQSAD